MKKPATYDRMGTAVIKKPNGFLYLTEDVDPLLDQMSGHIDAAKKAQTETSEAKMDVARLEGELVLRNHEIDDLKREMAEIQDLLKESEFRGASMGSMINRIAAIAQEGV